LGLADPPQTPPQTPPPLTGLLSKRLNALNEPKAYATSAKTRGRSDEILASSILQELPFTAHPPSAAR